MPVVLCPHDFEVQQVSRIVQTRSRHLQELAAHGTCPVKRKAQPIWLSHYAQAAWQPVKAHLLHHQQRSHAQIRLRWPMSGACQEPKLFHAGPSCIARRVGPFRSSLQQAQPARFGTSGILETGRQPTTQTAGADQRLNRAGHDCRRRQTSADANRSKLSWLSEKVLQLGGLDKSLFADRLS